MALNSIQTLIFKFSSTHQFISIPKPAKSFIPKWYKKAEQSDTAPSFKKCMPFIDAMTSGYMIELSQDIVVTQINGSPFMTWATDPIPVEVRDMDSSKGLSVPNGCDETISLAWNSTYNFKTPAGYSVLVTHPFNRYDLPFVTTSGIVDAGEGMHSGQIPFFLQKGFEGVIPKGTPIAQLLPYKIENWKSKEDKTLNLLGEKSKWEMKSVLSGWYKNNRWNKKEYN